MLVTTRVLPCGVGTEAGSTTVDVSDTGVGMGAVEVTEDGEPGPQPLITETGTITRRVGEVSSFITNRS